MNSELANTAGRACKAAEMAQKAVLVVGVLLAILSVVLGFYAPDQWAYASLWVTEDWQSIAAGVVGAVVILVQTLVVYAVLGVLDTKAEEVYYANAGEVHTM